MQNQADQNKTPSKEQAKQMVSGILDTVQGNRRSLRAVNELESLLFAAIDRSRSIFGVERKGQDPAPGSQDEQDVENEHAGKTGVNG
jgi:hypothetical protein